METSVYNATKGVLVTKVYVSSYSKPWVSEHKHEGNDKFFKAYRDLLLSSNSEIVSIKRVGDYDIANELTLSQLMSCLAYEMLTHGVVQIDQCFHRHSAGFGLDETLVNGAREVAERTGVEPRTAFEDGTRHFNMEQAEAAEKASTEFWAKVEGMKEGNK